MAVTTIGLHADKYEVMIQRRGRQVQWQEAIICSCWDNQTGNPVFSCKGCQGTGYTYGTPITGTALVMSITSDNSFPDLGGFEAGDAIMTVPKRYPVILANGNVDTTNFTNNPMFDISMYDLVTLLDDEYKSSEVLTKGTARKGAPADTLQNSNVTRIKQVRKVDINTGAVTTYVQGTDFILNGQTIQWQGTNVPNAGDNYSVVYFHRPTYRVFATLPKPRHQDGQDLPRYVALRYYMGGLT